MDLQTAIESVVNKLKGYTPTADPQIRYTHDTKDQDIKKDRIFRVMPSSIRWHSSPGNKYLLAELDISVFYAHRTEIYDLTKYMATDAEELFELLAYAPGNEWGGKTLAVQIASMRIERTETGGKISIALDLSYTKTS